MVPGAIAGSKAGAIRDAKGKSVYKVFQALDQGQKARILSELAAKLFSGAISLSLLESFQNCDMSLGNAWCS